MPRTDVKKGRKCQHQKVPDIQTIESPKGYKDGKNLRKVSDIQTIVSPNESKKRLQKLQNTPQAKGMHTAPKGTRERTQRFKVALSSQLQPMIKLVPPAQSATADAYLSPIITKSWEKFRKASG